MVIVAILGGTFFWLPEKPSTVMRSGERPRGQFVLRWSAVASDTYYGVRLATPQGRVLWKTEGLDETEAEVPETVFDEVAAGTQLLWQVEATLPGGARVASETFFVEVR